jgi:hypothetical protein
MIRRFISGATRQPIRDHRAVKSVKIRDRGLKMETAGGFYDHPP